MDRPTNKAPSCIWKIQGSIRREQISGRWHSHALGSAEEMHHGPQSHEEGDRED